ncbi:MAG: enoyl-ACP reductase [Gammaproteobacteria bacterium]|nr:enoyl-ACP reductase [Pseudomonadota bacterium]MCH9664044.1 enoyl-ACP reductase [Gammaproteobacteria bacterium]
MELLKGKKALVTGIASNRSIAWGIATSLAQHGADLVLSYSSERLRSRAEKCALECDTYRTSGGKTTIIDCDVGSDSSIDDLYTTIGQQWDGIDILVHSVAFAPREELEGDYTDVTTRAGFAQAHDISSYSLVALAKGARALMRGRDASILTLSYIGASRAIDNYNVMGAAKASLEANVRYLAKSLGGDGIRVNAISAGPLQTLAASGISGFRDMLDFNRSHCPLQRNLSTQDIGGVAVFLSSNLAACVTGEIIYADNGYHAIGIVSGT